MNIKKFLITATVALAALSMTAELMARPMGGGRSFGRQSSNVSRMAPRPAPVQSPTQGAQRPAAAPAPTPAAPPAARPSPWKGILGGALLGLGLGALFSHFGMGAGLASALGSILTVLLVVGVIFFLINMFRRRSQPAVAAPSGFSGNFGDKFSAPQPVQGGSSTPEIGSRLQPSAFDPVQPAQPAAIPHQQWGVPADFDQASFLRHAKSNFIRLQAAWDKADVNDIREFTTPEVFAELKMQIQERGGKADYTDVVQIDAELLGIENNGTDYLASVQFTGQIKPAPDALAEPFNEVWNLVKPVNGAGGWLLGGIQQLA
ncbi:Tim44 domain-containing protein [Massilia endophytica]|uniref:Tim44 domain-containing protein n=1 Tax=Massilia endophytica TaxID=2899220 RepID=UPI001E4B7931|nr:39S ribosomal protein L45 [Massilia endophytica]UGQ46824.1 39S ribosomal protein L45 [Massilia endophytica]